MFDWIKDQITVLAIAPLYPFWKMMSVGSTRYFWVYILTGLVLTAFLYWREREAAPTARILFKQDTWWSKSAQNDYLVVIIWAMLQFTLLYHLLKALDASAMADAVVWAMRSIGVTGTEVSNATILLGLALTVTLFVVDDFVKFFAHWMCHRIPELWEFHKVHHSAEHMNFVTAERIHPVEIVMTTAMSVLTIGTVNGIFIAFFGDHLTIATLFGANVFLVVSNIFGGVLRHSPVWLSFGPTLERYFISPAMHQIHHSEKEIHFDKNLGGALAVWDRMFGTHYIPKGREVESFGIGEETKEFRALSTIYFGPFQKSYAILKERFAGSGKHREA